LLPERFRKERDAMVSGERVTGAGEAGATFERIEQGIEAAVQRALDDLAAQEMGMTRRPAPVALMQESHTVAFVPLPSRT
jgi:hypothetical protein